MYHEARNVPVAVDWEGFVGAFQDAIELPRKKNIIVTSIDEVVRNVRKNSKSVL